MRSVLTLFKREKRGKAVLPPAVAASIDGASLVVRAGGDEGEPRVIVMIDGWSGFVFTDEKAANVLGKIFPDLCISQISLAVQRLRALAKARLRGLDFSDPDPANRPWKDRY